MHHARCVVAASMFVAAIASPALAADLKGHSARYRLEQAATTPKELKITGSLSIELRRTCTGYETSWSASYVLQRDRPKSSRQFEEALSTRESADGTTLEYSSRYRVDSRGTAAEGQARFGQGAEPGTLSVTPAGLAPDSRIQPGALPPVAFRTKIIDAMLAGERGPWIIPGIEMVRFHRSTDYRIEPATGNVAPPTPAGAPRGAQPIPQPKASGMPVAPPPPRNVKHPDPIDRGELMRAKSATLKIASYQIAEFSDLFVQLHVNGLVSKVSFRREGYDIVGSLVEVTAFPNPSCS